MLSIVKKRKFKINLENFFFFFLNNSFSKTKENNGTCSVADLNDFCSDPDPDSDPAPDP